MTKKQLSQAYAEHAIEANRLRETIVMLTESNKDLRKQLDTFKKKEEIKVPTLWVGATPIKFHTIIDYCITHGRWVDDVIKDLKERGVSVLNDDGTPYVIASARLDAKGLMPTGEVTVHDAVKHPSHYNQGGIECWDALESALGLEGYKAWVAGNVIKYVWRYKDKSGLEDLKKAKNYLDVLISKCEADGK